MQIRRSPNKLHHAILQVNNIPSVRQTDPDMMRGQDASSSCSQRPGQGMFMQMLSGMHIDCTEDIIQNENTSARIQRSGKGDSSFLPTTQVDSVGSDFGSFAVWKDFQIGEESAGVQNLLIALCV